MSRGRSAPRAALPDGPRGIAALRCLERMRVDFLAEIERLQARYGDVCHIAGGGQRYVVLYHPDDVEQVHVGSAAKVHKGFAVRRSRSVLGNGLVTSEGAEHAGQRRIVQPSLGRQRTASYADAMVDAADRVLATFPADGAFDVEPAMGRIGLSIIGRTMLGVDLGVESERIGRALGVARDQFAPSLQPWAPVTAALPLPRSIRFRRARRELRAIMERCIDERLRARTAGVTGDAPLLIDALLDARDDAGRALAREQVVDHLMTMVLAGYETVANTLVWALHCLAGEPAERAALEAEVDAVLAGRAPTVQDVDQLPRVRAAFLETLRLYPQCYSMSRTTREPFDCPNVRVERGWEVIVPQWSIHRDPRWWEDPSTFAPQRFLGASPTGADAGRPRYAYFPFSGGRRACTGQSFAMQEGVLVLARIVQRYRCARLPGADEPGLHAMFTLWPGATRMHVAARA